MSQEIEAWGVIKDSKLESTWTTESHAITIAREFGGTVVKLTGKMPRELRKVSTEVWITPTEVDPNSHIIFKRLGFNEWCADRGVLNVKARITMEELGNE